MKAVHTLPNYRMIKVTFLAPTNSRGARVKIYESKRYNEQKDKSKVFSFDYEVGNIEQQALDILFRNGWNVVSRCSELNNYVLLCDNWGDDFKEITDLV